MREEKASYAREVALVTRRIDHLYRFSPVAVLRLQIVDWTILRASRGFTALLGMDPDSRLVGTRLMTLLKVQSAQMDALEAHLGDSDPFGPMAFYCQDAEGRTLNLLVSGVLLEAGTVAELTLAPDPVLSQSNPDLEEEIQELESYRKMMMRREARLLELKSEVNQLLVESSQAPRYAIDMETGDDRIHELAHRKTKS
ncbi:MAG: hypothetical protein ACON39_06190 [Coraliomargaritaceae bacterium]